VVYKFQRPNVTQPAQDLISERVISTIFIIIIMSRYQREDTPFFTPEMDEVLRNGVRSSSTRRVRWEAIARLLPGASAKACKTRWEDIHAFSGLENMTFAAHQPLKRAATSRASSAIGGHSQRLRQLLDSSSPTARGGSALADGSKAKKSPRLCSGYICSSADKEEVDEGKDDMIVIHVCDEARGVNRDFHCSRKVLTSGMKYFRSYLSESASFDDIDISVHCDVNIFQWLMHYINHPTKNPGLDLRNVISILISSDFLQMDSLVAACLRFLRDHIGKILRSPVDLSCLNSRLIIQLSELFTPEQLDMLKDTKDKLSSKLFMRKLEKLLHDPRNQLYQCQHCGKLFTPAQQRSIRCPSSENTYIDFHGHALSRHSPTKTWDLRKYLLQLRAVQKLKWRGIFWRIFARLNSLECTRCGETFTLAELNGCKYHTQPPSFGIGKVEGKYACCGALASRFGVVGDSEGCTLRAHVPAQRTEGDRRLIAILDRLKRYLPPSSSPPPFQRTSSLDKPSPDAAVSRFARFSQAQRLLPVNLPSAPDTWDPSASGLVPSEHVFKPKPILLFSLRGVTQKTNRLVQKVKRTVTMT